MFVVKKLWLLAYNWTFETNSVIKGSSNILKIIVQKELNNGITNDVVAIVTIQNNYLNNDQIVHVSHII